MVPGGSLELPVDFMANEFEVQGYARHRDRNRLPCCVLRGGQGRAGLAGVRMVSIVFTVILISEHSFPLVRFRKRMRLPPRLFP
jgi:hypothetical protein